MKKNKTIQEIYSNHNGYVSDKWSIYLTEYNRLFMHLTESPIQLLEIGVQNGGSLEIWGQFFPKASCIIGCDINKECAKIIYSDNRIKLVIGDINNIKTRNKIISYSKEFDIIIDDGSHTSSDIIKSFLTLFPLVVTHGIYVIEDLHCSYWKKFEGGLYAKKSSMNFLKALADIINYEHWGVVKSKTEFLSNFGICQTQEIEALLSEIHSIQFINSMCIITKRVAEENTLGVRHVVGCQQLVAENKYANGTYSAPIPQDICQSDLDHKTATDLNARIAELESSLAAADKK